MSNSFGITLRDDGSGHVTRVRVIELFEKNVDFLCVNQTQRAVVALPTETRDVANAPTPAHAAFLRLQVAKLLDQKGFGIRRLNEDELGAQSLNTHAKLQLERINMHSAAADIEKSIDVVLLEVLSGINARVGTSFENISRRNNSDLSAFLSTSM